VKKRTAKEERDERRFQLEVRLARILESEA
jgi:hypothetical protein